MSELPVEAALPALREALRSHGAAVLVAPPGAGKTTRVPLALLHEPWLGGGRIVMLEPRRLAARAAARRMAALLGEPVGATVGYRVRQDARISRSTRVEVVTEGILTRMLQSDPALEAVGLVVFDEFHERSVHSDLGLALALQSRSLLRPELRLVAMSATLDGAAVAELLDAPVVASEGRAHPVETRYLERRVVGDVESTAARAVRGALGRDQGDVLVFLPGAREIARTAALLHDDLPPGARVLPLHGSLPAAEQDRAILPGAPGERKVVLSTSLAETSLTIEGVRVVVDAGRMRVPRFSARTGMTRLVTVPVSRASADQRRGRAGRLGPGVCYRLWTEAEQAGLAARSAPEILSADLAPLALELAAWGVSDPAELRWLDPPPEASLDGARELLRELGALRGGAITAHGRRMAELGTHPRLAHLLLAGADLGLGALACDVAALLEERDPLRGVEDADLRLRVEALRRRDARVDPAARARITAQAARWKRRLGVADDRPDADAAGLLVALAYPDRVARRREGSGARFLLRNGRGAALVDAQSLAREPFLAVADVDGAGREGRIHLAAPLDEREIREHFSEQLAVEEEIDWRDGALVARRRERLGAIVLRDGLLPDPPPEAVAEALLAAVERDGLALLPWSDAALDLRRRVAFLRTVDPDWPELGDEGLLGSLREWLGPRLHGVRSAADLARLDLRAHLLARLSWRQQAALDELAPTHLRLPGGARAAIDYCDPAAPSVSVRLQAVFGLAETPRVAGGRVPLTLVLLSPARRPVQVTRDLASFWREAYHEVRRELRGRYPKHAWPEDPFRPPPERA